MTQGSKCGKITSFCFLGQNGIVVLLFLVELGHNVWFFRVEQQLFAKDRKPEENEYTRQQEIT